MDKLRDRFEPISDGDIGTYTDNGIIFVEFRIPFKQSVRGDTRSSVQVSESDNTVERATIRLPETTGDAEELQDQILLISKRIFGREAGCYVRETGKIHMKYPVTGKIPNYSIEEFISDMEQFREEVENREIIA